MELAFLAVLLLFLLGVIGAMFVSELGVKGGCAMMVAIFVLFLFVGGLLTELSYFSSYRDPPNDLDWRRQRVVLTPEAAPSQVSGTAWDGTVRIMLNGYDPDLGVQDLQIDILCRRAHVLITEGDRVVVDRGDLFERSRSFQFNYRPYAYRLTLRESEGPDCVYWVDRAARTDMD